MPPLRKTDTEKEEFYEKLEQTYRQCPNNDAKLIIGDMNAKVGQEEMYRPTIGPYSVHKECNDNETLTWTSPDHQTQNQIDHVLIDLRHGSDILDCRNYRGANIDSDHYLIAGRIRARISNARNDKTKPKIIKYNVDKLKCTEVERKFQICLDRKISEHPRSEVYPTELNTNWEFMKTMLKETAEEVLGEVPKGQQNNWFDEECQRVTKEKNDAYLKMINKRTSSNVEEYRVNTKRKVFKPQANQVKALNGILLNERVEVLEKWQEHFSTLLNGESRAECRYVIEIEQEDTELQTLEEINKAIKSLARNKSPGADNPPAEIFKCGGQTFVTLLHKLLIQAYGTYAMKKQAFKSDISISKMALKALKMMNVPDAPVQEPKKT
ncbi:uncharacterized protein [Diabrotica undecimpunctata]|uniref:uncharacterized protein n=1 Tax=Diabrotica undecimpunctata TaxID=50387 RepID=UPI003B63C5FC